MGGNCSPRWGSRKRAGRTEHPYRYRDPPTLPQWKWIAEKEMESDEKTAQQRWCWCWWCEPSPTHKLRPDCIKTAGSKYPEIRMRFYFNILIFCPPSRNEIVERKKLCSPYIYSSFQSARHSSFGYEWTGNSLYSPLSTPEIKFAFEAFVLELFTR